MSTQSSKRLPISPILILVISALCSLCLADTPSTRPSTPRVVWRTSIGKTSDTPAAADNKHVVASSGPEIAVLSTADGTSAGRSRGITLASGSLMLQDSEFVAGHETGAALFFDDALPQWTFKAGDKVVGRPALAGGKVLAGSYDTNLYCLAVENGKELWRFKTDAQVHASPLVAGDLVIIGGCDGHLRAIDISTGKEKWSLDAGGPIAANPAFHDGRIYFATMSASVACADVSGKILWQVTPLKEESPFTASPAVSPDRLAFASDDGQLVLLDPAEGKTLAQGRLAGKPTAPLIFYNNQLLAGIDDGRIYLLDPATAKQTSRITLGGNPLSLIPTDHGLITNTTDGTVWLLK